MSNDDATEAESPPQAILPVFRGHEERYAHLREFFSIVDTCKVNNTSKDWVRLCLFPFSLKDQAKAWFTSLKPGSIHSWSEMKSAFLDEFYSISKTAAIRNKIKSFRQNPSEQFHEAFSRLKELLRTCPQHDVPKWELVKVFYDVLDYHNQQFMMATSGGTFFLRRMEEKWEFFEKLSKGSKTQALADRNNNHTSPSNFVSNRHGINFEISELSKKVDLLLRNLGKGVLNVLQVSHNMCLMCGDLNHLVNTCQSWGAPSNEELAEEVHKQEAGKLPSYPDLNPKHKPGGPEHVNMVTSLQNGKKADNVKSDSELVNDSLKYFPKPPTQNPKAIESPKVGEGGVSSTTTPYLEALEKSASSRLAKKGPHSEDMWETFKQLAEEVHKREAGKLPSYPDLNPKHKPGGPEHVNMVTSLQNGKKADNVKSDSELLNDLLKYFPKPPMQNPKATESPKVREGGVSSTTSSRLAKKGPHSEDMWETFKQVKINLPLLMPSSIPAYAKFLKDLFTQKRKLKATLPKKIDLTEHVSAVLSSSLPPKFKDPGALLILVMVGNITIKNALLDLGASINIFHASLVDKKLRLNVFNSLNSPISNDCYHIDTIDECIQTHTQSMNLDRTLENMHYVDSEKELFDGMMFHEKEEEFQMTEEEFLLSLEEIPLQSQQVQQLTLNEVQEYFDCLLVHQDVLLRACGSNKVNGCVIKRSQKKMVHIRLRRKHRRIPIQIKKRKFLRIRNKKVDELFALDTITLMVASFLKTY
uniref:Retrotransposon gag domain-containing protein n=1 Tax=Tanacetum cinerariifolium TaxID=118510 RepID=A0A6L2MIM5_TANCI|nr:hypothetical protein [Tanacetum cinerariifolium]